MIEKLPYLTNYPGYKNGRNSSSSSMSTRLSDNWDDLYRKVNFDPMVSVKEISERRSTSITPTITSPLVTTEKSKKLVSPPPNVEKNNIADMTDRQINALAENLLVAVDLSKETETKKKDQYHWMVYPEEPTPDYILEAKKRLGHIKHPKSAPTQQQQQSVAKQPQENSCSSSASMNSVSNSVTPTVQHIANPNRHWLTWDKPETPDRVKEIRQRLGDDRYGKKFFIKNENSLIRSKTMDSLKTAQTSSNEPTQQPIPAPLEQITENNSKTTDDELYKIPTYAAPSEEEATKQSKVNVINASNYIDNSNINNNSTISANPDDLNRSQFINQIIYSQAQSNTNSSGQQYKNLSIVDSDLNRNSPAPGVPFEDWMKTANEREKDAVLRVLNMIDEDRKNFPSSYSTEPKQSLANQYIRVKSSRNSMNPSQNSFNSKKSRPITPSIRKLGTTRNTHNFGIDENKEKLLINKYLWSDSNIVNTTLSGPSTVNYGYNL